MFTCLFHLFLFVLFVSFSRQNLFETSISSRLAFSGNWIEIAYGTSSGAVRVIVHHPETVSSGPQLFQTFAVHRSSVRCVTLSEKHLISGMAAPQFYFQKYIEFY